MTAIPGMYLELLARGYDVGRLDVSVRPCCESFAVAACRSWCPEQPSVAHLHLSQLRKCEITLRVFDVTSRSPEHPERARPQLLMKLPHDALAQSVTRHARRGWAGHLLDQSGGVLVIHTLFGRVQLCCPASCYQ